jgi:hypothetical protein
MMQWSCAARRMRVFTVLHRSRAILVALFLCACSAPSGYPARGRVGGQSIETRVDSEAARYYLTSYLAGARGDPALDERIDAVYLGASGSLPDRHELKRLSQEFSTDFAALHLADRIARIPVNRRFRETFDRALAQSRAYLPKTPPLPAGSERYEIMFVPGYLYRRHPQTGADFATPRAALEHAGIARHFVETGEDSAIEANAEIIAAALRKKAESGRRLIVVSASKSGPEVALALTELGAARTRHVSAWINIVGTLQGSGLADNGLWYDLEQLVGRIDLAGVDSLTTRRSRERFETFRLPEHLLVINYFGIPLSGTLSSWARPGFWELKSEGPNDGLSLLSDLIFPDGVDLPEIGRDHFLLDEQIGARTLALFSAVIEWLEQPRGR